MERGLRRYADPLILLLLAFTCYLLFFHRLGGLGLVGPDEPRYAAVAREMFLTGDYVTPRLHGAPWFEKPVLLYWGAVLGYALFGVNEIGVRFPSAAGATLSVFLIYLCCRRLWGRPVGLFAALTMASSVGFFSFARAAAMDMPLTACLTPALASFLIASHETGRSRRRWFYAFYAFLGLGLLAKGPIAVVLPGLALGAYMVRRRLWSEWKSWHPEGVLILFAVAAPWYVAVTWANGAAFINEFFINHNLQRFSSTIHGHWWPVYFYVPVLFAMTFPWTFMLIPALGRRIERDEELLLWWAAIPLVVFSLSGSKLPGYILPSLPPIAILCAKELWQPVSRSFRVAVFLEVGATIFLGILFGVFGHMLNVDPHVDGRVILAVAGLLAMALAAVAMWSRPWFLGVLNSASIALLVLAIADFIFPRFDATDTMRPWKGVLEELVTQDQVVFLYKPARWAEYGLQYYRYNKAQGIFSQEELLRLTENSSRVLCIAADNTLDELSRLTKVEMEVVQRIGKQTAFWAWQPGD